MQHQMDFWPAARKASHEQTPWESLSIEKQTETIMRLARIIAQTVGPPWMDETQEHNHEH